MNNKIVMIVCCLCLTIGVKAQGIKFEDKLTWPQVLAKARLENKYVFIDCYATWCGPCKIMDAEIYPNEAVGNELNPKFISVKLQMDKTNQDDQHVKNWYADAQSLSKEYKISGYPTYLFFSAEGKLMYQGLGAKDPDGFVKMVNYALTDPAKKYKTQLAEYKSGKMNYRQILDLITMASESGYIYIADSIARDYNRNYLNSLSPEQLCTADNIKFISKYYMLLQPADKFFGLLYSHPEMIDKFNIVSSEDLIKRMVVKELDKILYLNTEFDPITKRPNWKRIEMNIVKKYGKNYSQGMLILVRQIFYERIGDWQLLAKYNLKQIELSGLDTTERGRVLANNMFWTVFVDHTQKAPLMSKAVAYMKTLVSVDIDNRIMIDTYANLLYRSGNIQEAIKWETKAVLLEEKSSKIENRSTDKVFEDTLRKMVEGKLIFAKK